MPSTTLSTSPIRILFLASLLGMAGLLLTACSEQQPSSEESNLAAAEERQHDRPVLRMGIFPRRSVVTTKKAFRPLADYLSEQLNADVQMVVPLNFQRFWAGVEEGMYDLVHFNQYHYIVSNKNFGYKVLLSNQEMGRDQISGALIVRRDSNIKTVEDLKGKRIVFGGGKKAMGSYIAPLAILKQHGLEPKRDFEVSFAKTPIAAVVKVNGLKYDAGGAGSVVIELKATKKRTNVELLKILATSAPFTHLPWAVNKDMPEVTAQRIQQLMVSLKDSEQGRGILKAARVTAFTAVKDEDFAKVREIAAFALGENY